MKSFIPVLFILVLIFAVSGCSHDKHMELSDLGGVYSSTFDDLDLAIEVSGQLSEGSIGGIYTNIPSNYIVVTTSNQSNKLLCWGIRRKPNNETPDADPGAPAMLKKYYGVYIGDTSRKTIYLTFDEGYENGYTPKILNVLKDNNVKAAFFITGPYLNAHQDLVRRMVEEGHIVGNHTIHHPSLPSCDDKRLEEEVLGLSRAFKEKFGEDMNFLRPPKGEYSERTLEITSKLGYCNVFWSFAYDDWYRDKTRGADYAYNKVMNNIHNGAVLLLHAVSKDNAEALDNIIKSAKKSGYSFGTLDDLNPMLAEE